MFFFLFDDDVIHDVKQFGRFVAGQNDLDHGEDNADDATRDHGAQNENQGAQLAVEGLFFVLVLPLADVGQNDRGHDRDKADLERPENEGPNREEGQKEGASVLVKTHPEQDLPHGVLGHDQGQGHDAQGQEVLLKVQPRTQFVVLQGHQEAAVGEGHRDQARRDQRFCGGDPGGFGQFIHLLQGFFTRIRSQGNFIHFGHFC